MRRNRFQNKIQPKKNSQREGIEVFCRIRPLPHPGAQTCMTIISPSVVQLTAPPNSVLNKNGPVNKDVQFTFKQIFDENTTQKQLFETVALPLVENVLNGKNGLLFTYGVTGSGKTYTMTGAGKDGGIMPRCIDTIFKSILPYKAEKYVFKSDKLNGFEMQSGADAMLERQHDFLTQLTPAKSKQPKLERKNSDEELFGRVSNGMTITNLDEDNLYAVFVTFVEIYNNSVYDLLEEGVDEGGRARLPQVKIVREDSDHNMFVHGVNEVEVTSAEEAYDAFYRGQRRRRVAHTALNAESSRAHTIFTIRVVQAPVDDRGQRVSDKRCISIGQLSLVDLAGSERTNRTKNTGLRLREAGNINNSLMTLRTCLELLRENQKGANKMVPYRDSRLTHLFKSFFEGEGHVSMVVCVNPLADEYDETIQVMKFAVMSQEVQIACPTPKPQGPPPGRRRFNQVLRQLVDFDNEKDTNENVLSAPAVNPLDLFTDLPSLGYISHDDVATLKKIQEYLQTNLELYSDVGQNIVQRGNEIREMVMKNERKAFMSTQEMESLKSLYEKEKERAADYEGRMKNSDSEVTSIKRKLDEYELNVKRLRRELSEKELIINKNKLRNEKIKEDYSSKIAQTQDKLKSEMERKLRSQKSAMEFELRSRERRMKEAKRVLSDEALPSTPLHNGPAPLSNGLHTVHRFQVPSSVCQTPLSERPPSPNFRSTGRKAGPPVVSRRYMRRSRSADTWLEHRPTSSAVPLGTVFQPTMAKRKSVSKLTDVKDVTSGPDRYCLVTQGQDSEGDLETRLYKGDVLPTVSGGAQVMFSDVEILKQKSPSTSPVKRRPELPKRNPIPACSVAIEGHKKY